MENTILYNMLDQVVSNEDNYCWRDLDCVYRPWSAAFKSFGEEYLEAMLLLTSFFTIYTPRKNKREILNFPLMYDAYLNDYFGIKIKKTDVNSKQELIDYVKHEIDNGRPVLIPVDLNELSYNPMYKKEHRYKYMIIKGYDIGRELFYILDNIHIDFGSATILTDFTSTFDEMYSMNHSFYEFFDPETEDLQYFYSLDASDKNRINSYTSLKFLHDALKEMEEGRLEYIHFEEVLVDMEIDDDHGGDVDEIFKSLNLKVVFTNTLFLLLDRFLSKEETSALRREIFDINEEWHKAKTDVLYLKLRNGEPTRIKEAMNVLKRREHIAVQKLITCIGELEHEEMTADDKVAGFEVVNNKKAHIELNGKDIIVKHSQATTYDTWLMQDYAVQFMIPDVNRPMSLESKVDVKQNIGDDIHSGIIVKFSDGHRYLFGNYRGERIALFCPNLEEDYSIYECLNFDNNMEKEDKSNSYFKVVYTGEELEFHCLNIATLVDECIYKLPTQGKDFSMGLFSKTWEKLDHTVRFYDISIA